MKTTTPEYRRVRVVWPDHLGLARGKYLSRAQAALGTGHCQALFALGFDRNMTPHEGSGFYDGLPDVSIQFEMSSIRRGWEADTGLVVGNVMREGRAVMMCPREVLKKAVSDWRDLGYRVRVGIELEAFLLQRDPEGRWGRLETPGAYVYATGATVDPAGVIDSIMEQADKAGLRLESVHSEYDNGQFELTLEHDEVLQACDDAFLFKLLAKELAQQKGFLLTFLGKPFTEHGGSGTHINMSLSPIEKPGAAKTRQSGENPFYDSRAKDGLSKLMLTAIGGLLEHHRGMTAVVAPTVNAYKRLRPGQMCGFWANWGYDHRGVAVRVPPARGTATRIEHRLADGATNPHIAAAATLQAARLGVHQERLPPEAETMDCWSEASTDVHSADNLAEALSDLEADDSFVAALSPEYVDAFVAVKRAEWNRYAACTTDWELNEYLHFL